jgi:hypothetical protein
MRPSRDGGWPGLNICSPLMLAIDRSPPVVGHSRLSSSPVTAATDTGATTATTTRDPAGALVGLRSGADRFYYPVDGLGSVAAMTDSSGAVTYSYAYDPYGVTTETTASSVANPWRYTGQYQTSPPGCTRSGPGLRALEEHLERKVTPRTLGAARLIGPTMFGRAR